LSLFSFSFFFFLSYFVSDCHVGKSSVCKAILERLDVQWVAILPTDSFYRPLTREQIADVGNYNFDHPSAFDWPLLIETLRALKRCEKVDVPHYDFVTHSRLPTSSTIYGADVIIVEGILALYHKEVRAELDMRIFVDTDSDVRLCRRLRRDIAERGRDVNGVLAQYERFVKPAFDEFVQPTRVPWFGKKETLEPQQQSFKTFDIDQWKKKPIVGEQTFVFFSSGECAPPVITCFSL
jgi:uridine kinase